MKKILLLFYVLLLSVILYQMLLGKNGILEGYRLSRESLALETYIMHLKKNNELLKSEIDQIKKNPGHRENLAEGMGYFRDNVILYRVLKDKEPVYSRVQSDEILNTYVESVIQSSRFDKIRILINTIFFIIISLFALLITFWGNRE